MSAGPSSTLSRPSFPVNLTSCKPASKGVKMFSGRFTASSAISSTSGPARARHSGGVRWSTTGTRPRSAAARISRISISARATASPFARWRLTSVGVAAAICRRDQPRKHGKNAEIEQQEIADQFPAGEPETIRTGTQGT